jgi:hypothetical protein
MVLFDKDGLPSAHPEGEYIPVITPIEETLARRFLHLPFEERHQVPGLITPGQRITVGTRNPPSQFVAFSPRKGVLPPSGQVINSAPLSVV